MNVIPGNYANEYFSKSTCNLKKCEEVVVLICVFPSLCFLHFDVWHPGVLLTLEGLPIPGLANP